MFRKGISPLIATVLIIGFTVALAAVLIAWGTGFTREIQAGTEETSSENVMCATDVVFNIVDVCEESTGDYKVTISNDGSKDINELRVRFFRAADDVDGYTMGFSDGIVAFDVESSNQATTTGVKRVEAFPVVDFENRPVTCAGNIKSFGSLDANAIGSC